MGVRDWAVTVPAGYRVGDWVVDSPIATGSWGSVYEGHRLSSEADDGSPSGPEQPPTRAALKFLPTGTLTPRQLSHLADMAEREVRLHRTISHARVVTLYEVLTVDDPAQGELDGASVLVMERAVESLADVLASTPGRPVPGAARLVAEICDGLAYMHEGGWVHGDLKPSNVLVSSDGSVKLGDFGLATELEGTHGYLPPLGSSDYVPPERRSEPLGERGTAVRVTGDVWALGVTACELLTGSLPFLGATPRARAAMAADYAAGRQPLPLPPGLDSGWHAFVADCLAPDHERRCRWPASALAERAHALAHDPHRRRPRRSLRRAARPGSGPHRRSRRRMVTLAVGATVLVGSGIGGWSLAQAPDEPDYSRWLATDADIPARFVPLVVKAGTTCDESGVSPALVGAMLEAESGFDPGLRDPAMDEYGIARWTPSVLQYYMPPGRRATVPRPPFPPSLSIPAVGRYLCKYAAEVEPVPGQDALNLAAAYRTSASTVREEGGVPERLVPYISQVRQNLARYRPSD